METVNKLATAASQAIWGDQTTKDETDRQEPLSGKTGDVQSGEPYDKGNDAERKPLSSDPTAPDSGIHKSSAGSTNPANEGSTLGAATGTLGSATGHSSNPTSNSTQNPSAGAGILGSATEHSSQSTGNSTQNPSTGSGILGASNNARTANTAHSSNPRGDHNYIDEHQETKRAVENAAKANTVGSASTTSENKTHPVGTGNRLSEDKHVHHTQPSSSITDTSKDDDEKDGNGKVSLKDKIKAKLHKH